MTTGYKKKKGPTTPRPPHTRDIPDEINTLSNARVSSCLFNHDIDLNIEEERKKIIIMKYGHKLKVNEYLCIRAKERW